MCFVHFEILNKLKMQVLKLKVLNFEKKQKNNIFKFLNLQFLSFINNLYFLKSNFRILYIYTIVAISQFLSINSGLLLVRIKFNNNNNFYLKIKFLKF